jgi:hypothetical protein
MDQKTLTWAKFAAIGIVLVGGFVLVGVGRLDAAKMYADTSTMIGALVVALGITGAASRVGEAMNTATRAKLEMAKAPDASHHGGPS